MRILKVLMLALVGLFAAGTALAQSTCPPTTCDQYGGLIAVNIPGGATGRFRVATVGNRIILVDALGHPIFALATYNMDFDDRFVNVPAKYGAGARETWAEQAVKRLLGWNFNSIGEFSTTYVLPSNPAVIHIPFTVLLRPALTCMRDDANFTPQACKDLIDAQDHSVYTGGGNLVDVFDTNWVPYVTAFIPSNQGIHNPAWGGLESSVWSTGASMDEVDMLRGFGPGPEIPGSLRIHPHIGWLAISANPVFAGPSPTWGKSYPDAKVYSKFELQAELQAKYVTIGALNTAWGSNYTTFGTAGGYGVGTGFLDENGRHTAWLGTTEGTLVGVSAAVQTDMDAFLLKFAQQYFSIVANAIRAADPNMLVHGPIAFNSWHGLTRKQILQAAGQSCDIISATGTLSGPVQQQFDLTAQYTGNKPVMVYLALSSQTDSPYLGNGNPGAADGTDDFSTQATRGSGYLNEMNFELNYATTSGGLHTLIGMKWWDWFDSTPEGVNWGIVSEKDNTYDGHEPVTATVTCSPPNNTLPANPICGGEVGNFGNFTAAVTSTNTLWRAVLAGTSTVSTITVNSSNPGSGVLITASPGDLTAKTTVITPGTFSYNNGTPVALTAPVTAAGNNFSSWTGCDSVSGPGNTICNLNVTASRIVIANYIAPATNTLTISSVNPASGVAMVVSPADVNGATNGTTSFTRIYPQFSAVTVTAPSTRGANTFASWTGCDSVSGLACSKTMNANATVTATYASPATFTLSVASTLPATGVAITVSPADVNAQSNGSTPFSRTYVAPTSVTLTAPLTAGGNNFSNWTGCDSVSGPSNSICTKNVTTNATVTANFTPPVTEILTIASVNPASGVAMVVSPADVNGATNGSTTVTRTYPQGTAVTITAPSTSGSNTFALWTGCDSVSGFTCNKTMNANAVVTASYTSPATFTVNVLSTNPASGVAITVSPTDINGATNGATPFGRTYISTTATFTAPLTVSGNNFSSWTGCDSVSGPGNSICTKLVNANVSVTANYASPATEILTIASANPTTGVAMTVSPADVNSQSNGSTLFTRIYLQGTTVTITAAATSGLNTFGSWMGCDTATGVTCIKTMITNVTVTATYTSPATFTLSVSSKHPNSGVGISVSPPDIKTLANGITQFVRSYVGGTTVTLVAALTAGSNSFSHWTGCDVAVGAICTKQVNANAAVTAFYNVHGAKKLLNGTIRISGAVR
jgi:hypothetical protein